MEPGLCDRMRAVDGHCIRWMKDDEVGRNTPLRVDRIISRAHGIEQEAEVPVLEISYIP